MSVEVISIIFMIVGLIMVSVRAVQWIRWRSTRNWRPSAARVYSKSMKKRRLTMWPSPIDEYEPTVEYEYLIGDVPFKGSKITVWDRGLASVDSADVRNVLDSIQGDTVAYVKPFDPREAVLRRGAGWMHISHLLTHLIVGGMFFVVGLMMFIYLRA